MIVGKGIIIEREMKERYKEIIPEMKQKRLGAITLQRAKEKSSILEKRTIWPGTYMVLTLQYH